MDPKGTALMLSHFPIHAPCPRSNDWYLALYRAVREKLGIPPSFEPGIGGGYSSRRSPPWDGVDGELVGGIRVLGTKKRPYGEGIRVDYALFAPDGTALAWAGSLSPEYPTPASEILFTTPDGARLALDGAVKAAIKAMVKALPKPSSKRAFEADFPLSAVQVAPGGRVVAGADRKGSLYQWDPNGVLLSKVRGGGGGMKSLHEIAFSPSGDRVVVGAGAITVFEVPTGATLLKLGGHPKGEVWGVDWSPCGTRIASASSVNVLGGDNSVALWDASTGALIRKWPFGFEGCNRVRFSPDGASLVVATEHQGSLRRIDLATGEVVARWDTGTWSADGLARVADAWATVVGPELVVCAPDTLEPIRRLPSPVLVGGRPGIAATPDGRVVGCAYTSRVGVIDARTGALLRELPLPAVPNVDHPECGAVATDGRRVFGAVNVMAVSWEL